MPTAAASKFTVATNAGEPSGVETLIMGVELHQFGLEPLLASQLPIRVAAGNGANDNPGS